MRKTEEALKRCKRIRERGLVRNINFVTVCDTCLGIYVDGEHMALFGLVLVKLSEQQ